MAAVGREPKHERHVPVPANVITHTQSEPGGGADEDRHIHDVITCAHPLGQVSGENEPEIANCITKPGPNK